MATAEFAESAPPKLGFGEALSRSFSGLWQAVARLPVSFAAVVFVLAVIAMSQPLLGSDWLESIDRHRESWGLIARLARSAVGTTFTVPVCIAVQYLILRGAVPGWRLILRAAPAYYVWSLLFGGVQDAVMSIQAFLPPFYSSAHTGWILTAEFAGVLAVMAVSARLWLIFPGIVAGPRMKFLDRAAISWRQTRGWFWSLLGILLLTTLALLVPFTLVEFYMRIRTAGAVVVTLGPHASLTLHGILIAIVSGMYGALDVTLSSAAGAVLYRALVEGGGPIDVEGTAAHFT